MLIHRLLGSLWTHGHTWQSSSKGLGNSSMDVSHLATPQDPRELKRKQLRDSSAQQPSPVPCPVPHPLPLGALWPVAEALPDLEPSAPPSSVRSAWAASVPPSAEWAGGPASAPRGAAGAGRRAPRAAGRGVSAGEIGRASCRERV